MEKIPKVRKILTRSHTQKDAVFDRNANAWVTLPKKIKLPKGQQDRDMLARELLIKFQMSPNHPLVQLKRTYAKGDNLKLVE